MKEKPVILTTPYESPCGTLVLGALGPELCLCDWQASRHPGRALGRLRRLLGAEQADGTSAVILRAIAQLDEYFAGKRKAFDVPLRFAGTDFQQKVWTALLSIPYGATVSYADLARQIGHPRAVRAVGNANGANPISVFAPCHRVIGSDRTPTGYGGGLAVKAFLLELEKGRP